MSKTLILMRHGEAAHSAVRDFDRLLTTHGVAQAKSVGAGLALRQMIPQKIIHSPALRTSATAKHVAEALVPIPPLAAEKMFYGAEPEDIIRLTHMQDASSGTLMLVGHNPWVHYLALLLAAPETLGAFPSLKFSFPPSSCAVVQFEGDTWSSVQKGKGVLKDYFVGNSA